MSERYYYDDPLEAAWMAKHHGMLFELVMFDIDTKEIVRHPLGDCLEWPRLNLDTEQYSLHYYIHRDSLHLLEPQVGDLIGHTKTTLYAKEEPPVARVEYHFEKWPRDAYLYVWNDLKIVLRNDILFHWPKTEEEQTHA